MKQYIFLILIMLLVVSVNAKTFEQDTEIDLKHPVRIDDFPSDSLSCNISVFDPDNEILIDFETMTNNYEFHNFTLDAGNTTKIGDYLYDITCTTGASNKTESFEFEITPSGFTNMIGFYILVIFLSLGIMILGFWLKDAIIVIFGSFGLDFFALYVIINGIVGIKNNQLTWAIGLIILGISGYIGVRSALETITN